MQPSASPDEWKVREMFILHETPEVLAETVISTNRALFARIIAANRLAEYFPDQAGPTFASASKGLREGSLLACIIDLSARIKTKALQESCRTLVEEREVPEGIVEKARAYLSVVTVQAQQDVGNQAPTNRDANQASHGTALPRRP